MSAKTYLTIHGTEKPRPSVFKSKCAQCGMPTWGQDEYHPYLACLAFEACHNSETVTANLRASVAFGEALGAPTAPGRKSG